MSDQKPPAGPEQEPQQPTENEPPYPANVQNSTAGAASTQPPAGPPPGSPQAPPASSQPQPGSPQGPVPGPLQHGATPNGYPGQPGAGYGGYPPQQQGYPQQPQGYPQQPQQGGYPPQPQGYPQPQQSGYPQSYPPQPQHSGYPQSYPPQPQQGGYPPQPGYLQQAPRPAAPPRPPLAPRQKRGAMLAGAVSFTLMSLGFTLFIIPLVIGLFGAFFGTLFTYIANNNPEDFTVNGGPAPEDVSQIVSDLWATFLPWLIGSLILGIIIWILGYFCSLWMLRSHRVNRPVAVTWSGLGIAIVGSFLLSALSSPISGLFGLGTPNFDSDDFSGSDSIPGFENFDFGPIIGLGVLFFLLSLLVNAGIGLLSWWWMAHAFRDRSALSENEHPETRLP
ncbi:putative membrane protein [Okibacterium sp. HSC-33S16]|uniref:DUF2062 domain-containing protein n=1 Tax=Okibacterium sp. HSC-33S16 TaxID=2910965 RepID=UPI00209FA503|nr:DUF2062 domain-containing protein [Okibacterium sp. HSC-33S16]MCP2031342.1 putative membrane protein [Okibacterium sp. HSC-33S16]